MCDPPWGGEEYAGDRQIFDTYRRKLNDQWTRGVIDGSIENPTETVNLTLGKLNTDEIIEKIDAKIMILKLPLNAK